VLFDAAGDRARFGYVARAQGDRGQSLLREVLRSDAERAWEMFRDPRRSGVVVVTLPEEMPTNETLELCAAVQGELTLPIAK